MLPLLCLAGAMSPAWAEPAALEHSIEVSLQPDNGDIEIRDSVRVDGLEQYSFPLARWLDQVEVRSGAGSLETSRVGDYIVLQLPHSGPHDLEFELRGRLPALAPEGSQQSGGSGADGAFLPAYANWIAQPPDRAMRYRLEVTVPAGYRAIVTGRLVEESAETDYYRASFVNSRAGEPPSLFAGPYRVAERIDDGTRIRTYFHEEIERQADDYLDAASSYIRRYRREIGDYPYADFHIVSGPLPVGLGFSGLTYIDRRIVPLPFMRARSLAHEVAHNWWGNAIAVDYAGGNWAEGLTTFMADYALELDKSDAAARNMRVKWLRDYAALPEERDHAVRDFTSKQHQAAQVIGYNKVAFIFHMLREEIGEQAFADGIRGFWTERQFTTASWRDLQASFEKAAARPLDWFFRQWLDRPGAPRLSLGGHRVETKDGGHLTRIEILQPVSGYRFAVNVSLVTEAGEETRRIVIEDRLTRLEWATPARPQSIELDPHTDLFRRLQTGETPPIMRDITLNPDSVTLVAGSQPGFADTARRLAGRMLDTTPNFLAPDDARGPAQPLLLIVDFDSLPGQLERLQLTEPAGLPRIEHDAVAWTARLANNTPVVVVAAASTQALQALLRPLPHYGGQSYVLFDGGRAQSRGLWPLSRGALYRDLSDG